MKNILNILIYLIFIQIITLKPKSADKINNNYKNISNAKRKLEKSIYILNKYNSEKKNINNIVKLIYVNLNQNKKYLKIRSNVIRVIKNINNLLIDHNVSKNNIKFLERIKLYFKKKKNYINKKNKVEILNKLRVIKIYIKDIKKKLYIKEEKEDIRDIKNHIIRNIKIKIAKKLKSIKNN